MFDRHIAFTARQAPDLIAVSDGRQQITYREFDRAIDGVAALIADALGLDRSGSDQSGPDRSDIVGIAVADGYRHALLALACARLGVASASLFAGQAASMAVLAGATLLLGDDPAAGGTTIDSDWFARAEGRVAPSLRAGDVDPAALGRVHFSSGSTGVPKAVEVSWRTVGVQVNSAVLDSGESVRRTLTLIAPESGGFRAMLACWRHRGCVLFGPSSVPELAARLARLAPTWLAASPVQMASLLDALPTGMAPFPGIEISIAGGKLTRALAERAAIRLGGRVINVYGSSEAGATAYGYAAALPDDGTVGHVMPASRVEIVDEDGVVVPHGTIGRVRVHGSELAMGYRGDPSNPAFTGGGFTSNDLGSLDGDGLLRIVGRVDEVMNAGGEKFLPDTLEDKVRPVAGVGDVAAFALEGDDGIAQVWLAIVRDGAVDEAAVARALDLPGLPAVRLAWIEAIPRTLMGKIRRDELRDAARALERQAAR